MCGMYCYWLLSHPVLNIRYWKKQQQQTMFLIQQLYLLQNVLPHFGKASASLLPTSQHQAVLIVTSADAIQRLSHGLSREKHIIHCFRVYECINNKTPHATDVPV